MFLTGKRDRINWKKTNGVNTRRLFGYFDFNKMLILEAAWKKESGALRKHCSLLGATKNSLIVKTDSSIVSNELLLRAGTIVANMNKYFNRPWLKCIKISDNL